MAVTPPGRGREASGRLLCFTPLDARFPANVFNALESHLTQIRADSRSDHTACQSQRQRTLLGTWLRNVLASNPSVTNP
jgi:hypothetical protein